MIEKRTSETPFFSHLRIFVWLTQQIYSDKYQFTTALAVRVYTPAPAKTKIPKKISKNFSKKEGK